MIELKAIKSLLICCINSSMDVIF